DLAVRVYGRVRQLRRQGDRGLTSRGEGILQLRDTRRVGQAVAVVAVEFERLTLGHPDTALAPTLDAHEVVERLAVACGVLGVADARHQLVPRGPEPLGPALERSAAGLAANARTQ